MNSMNIGGPVRDPTPEFEAWWGAERAWYEAQFAATSEQALPAQASSSPPCRPRGARRRRTRQRKDSSDDDGEPDEARPRLVAPSLLKLHPRASLVPEQRPDEYEALLEDIRAARRVHAPLVVRGNVVLDGRHRLRAATELGLPHVPVVEAPDDGRSDEAVILATALHRRHLNDDQRAMLAAGWAEQNPTTRGEGRARDVAALEFGVSSQRVKKARFLLGAAPAAAERVRAGELRLGEAVAKARLEAQVARIGATRSPTGKYRTVVVDPPWRYELSFGQGVVAREYPTMSDGDIMALPVSSLLDSNAHVYLWTTGAKLETAYSVMRAWGLQPQQLLVWDKQRLGLGHYFRNEAEFIVFAARGKTPLRRRDLGSVIRARSTGHSVKPDEFFKLVEKASFAPRLEMFARGPRRGWSAWGAEAEGRVPVSITSSGVDSKAEEGGPT